MAVKNEDFIKFCNEHSEDIRTNLNLTDTLLFTMRTRGYIDQEANSNLESKIPYQRNREFVKLLMEQPADFMTADKTEILIDVLRNRQHPRPNVEKTFTKWLNIISASHSATGSASASRGGQQEIGDAGCDFSSQPSTVGTSPNARKLATIDFDVWCNFLNDKSEEFRRTLNMHRSVVERLRVTKVLNEIEAGQINKFSDDEEDEKAVKFLALIKDKAAKIDIMIEVFSSDRYQRATPAQLLSNFLQAQQ